MQKLSLHSADYCCYRCQYTVKPLMFACPLFHEFREPNKTAKLNGANINCRPKIGRDYYSISNYMVLIRQNRRGQNNLHAKSPTFRAARLKGFTVHAVSAQFVKIWWPGTEIYKWPLKKAKEKCQWGRDFSSRV